MTIIRPITLKRQMVMINFGLHVKRQYSTADISLPKSESMCRVSNLHEVFFRFVKVLVIVLAAGISFLAYSTLGIYAQQVVVNPSDGIDVVLVIDTSGSMNTADPERIALEAATLFMDMMETRNSRIGIVGFSGTVHSAMPLTAIYEPNIRDNIRNTVSTFDYVGWTDIGLALRTAAEMLLESPLETNSPMILLITDGRVDLPAWFDRTIDMSYYDAWWAVDNVGDNVPIYTIGLNYNNTVNIEFLEEIAVRTHASSAIIEDAALLPEIFHNIFASHIRSSIYQIATIFPDGETYSDVTIPIDSSFVAEANIIMLSSRPITNLRLYDPTGREIIFENNRYTLTAANRYSMIKLIEPMQGDWTLMVQGLPNDRITVNLIYNYSIDIAFSITQPQYGGAFFDPSQPILVQASFISTLPDAQQRTIFEESTATINVFDLDMNPLDTVYMTYNGTSFVAELLPNPPQNIRINIQVVNPNFTQQTAMLTITYDPDKLEALAHQPQDNINADTPTADNDTTYTPIEAPTTEDVEPVSVPIDAPPSRTFATYIIVAILVLLVVLIVMFLLRTRQIKRKVFYGHLEVRAMLKNKIYTALEAPDLSTFAGRISIAEFLDVSIGVKAKRILDCNIPITGVFIEPKIVNNRNVILLTTDGACLISDGLGEEINQRKFTWGQDVKLVFSVVDTIEKIEITYRISN